MKVISLLYSLLLDAVANALLDPLGSKLPMPKIQGVNAGRNSFDTIRKSTTTKLQNGSVSSISANALSKSVVVETVNSIPSEVLKSSASRINRADVGAGGGFVIYPNKVNFNTVRNVYSK